MNDWDKLYCEINYLALLINRHTDYAVWLSMEGHVPWTSIRIAKSKKYYWDKIIDDEISRHVEKEGTGHYRDWNGSCSIEKLTKIRDQLKHILETGEVNYDGFDKMYYETWDYVFEQEKHTPHLPILTVVEK